MKLNTRTEPQVRRFPLARAEKAKGIRRSDVDVCRMGQPSLTVIIPTMNERHGIQHVLSSMPRNIRMQIVVVDTSSDGTAEIAEELGASVIREGRRGYGRALQTGIKNAKGKIVVYIDADGTYDPGDIPKIAEPILKNESDVVLGNRLNGNTDRNAMKPLNRIGNKMLSFVFSMIFGQRISDTQCGLRAIKRELLGNIECQEYGMPYVTEQLIGLLKKGARIGEVEINYRRRIGNTKLVPLTDGLRILRSILKQI